MIARSYLLTLALLLASTAHASAIPCQTSGKTWRLIDGKRCWTERWVSKDKLHWAAPRSHRPIAQRVYDRRRAPPPLPQDRPRSAYVDRLAEALTLRADVLRANMAWYGPPKHNGPPRVVLPNPYKPPNEHEDGGTENFRVPYPRPRPAIRKGPPLLQLVPLVLAGLLIGYASVNLRGLK